MDKPQICLWFDTQAEEAARFYASLFQGSKVGTIVRYGKAGAEQTGLPFGSVMTVDFELAGTRFLGLNGGPIFDINPTVSFFVGCESEQEIKSLWSRLAHSVRMDLDKYPFAEKYGWCQDRFGVNWQLMLSKRRQKISPAFLFANEAYGKASAAIELYTSVLPGSKVEMIAHDPKSKAILHSTVTLAGQDFVFMEGPLEPEFEFSPAVSIVVPCDSQAELDTVWNRLTAVREAEQCGWLADKFGISWQIIHRDWVKMMGEADPATQERLMEAVLKMKKIDLEPLFKIAGR